MEQLCYCSDDNSMPVCAMAGHRGARSHLKRQLMRFEAVARVLAQPLQQLDGLTQGVLNLRQPLTMGVWVLLFFLCWRLQVYQTGVL